MKSNYLFTKRSKARITLADAYEDIATDWQAKAERLQARRWRKIKHQLV